MKVQILGSGTSTGVPVIGCKCSVCRSQDTKDKRTRASVLIEVEGSRILVDTSPEMRLQLVAAQIDRVDAVIYTHLHADHSAGFDDLRAFWFHSKQKLPVHLLPEYEEELRTRFAYAFSPTGYHGATPEVEIHPIDQSQITVAGLPVDTLTLEHGNVRTCALRIGSFAYATDFKKFTAADIDRWRGKIDVMVASGIHFRTHGTHSVIPETLELFDSLQVKEGVITHLSHEVSYLKHSQELPPGRSLAYDGMVIDL